MANGYLKKRDESRDALIRMAQDMERQYMADIFCILLHEMHGFGAERLTELMLRVCEKHDNDIKMFQPEYVEADVMRDHFDDDLKAIFGEKFDPFEVRYEYAKEIDYERGHRNWRK